MLRASVNWTRVDKVYSKKNSALAWEIVRRNDGAGGVDRLSLDEFVANLAEDLDQLYKELRAQRSVASPTSYATARPGGW